MGVRSSSTRRTSAASAISGQIVAINTPAGGVSVAGGRITASTPVSLGVVTAGQSSAASVVVATTAPTVTSLIITDSSFNNLDDTAFDVGGGYAKIIGTNFKAGASAYVNGQALTTTFTSANELRVVVPASAIGSYSLMVFNTDGSGAIYLGLGVSNLPSFVTAAGTLGTFYETTNIVASTTATGDSPITYTLYSGSLPPGATLAADGTITGTSPTEASSTVYSFVIKATDPQNQDSYRAFSITISADVVTWNSPAQGTINLDSTAITPVVLSATAATGNAVSYSVDTLPDGLSFNTNTITGTPTTEGDTVTTLTATSAVTNRTATRTVTWSVSLSDIYFKYTTLLLSGDTAIPSFTNDASLNNAQLTIVGDTKPSSFNPYEEGYYSYFGEGSSASYLSLPTRTGGWLTSGNNFTVEAWVNMSKYPQAHPGYNATVAGTAGNSNGWEWTFNGSTGSNCTSLTFAMKGVASATYTGTFLTNTWYHIAAVRNGTTLTVYVNGVAGATTATLNTWTDNADLRIGADTAPSYPLYFYGNISNFRIVSNTAVYTSTFTPPTGPLTAITNTLVLACQSNRFIDNSSNNFVITKNGDAKVSSAMPFTNPTIVAYNTQYSTKFDGTGDYLTTAANTALDMGTGDFTIECFVNTKGYAGSQYGRGIFALYPSGNYNNRLIVRHTTADNRLNFYGAAGGNPYLGTSGTDGTTALVAGTWNHIAVVRQSGVFRLYINGVQDIVISNQTGVSLASSNCFDIGRTQEGSIPDWNGLISNFRVIKGTCLYPNGTTFTKPSTTLTAVAGTSLLTCQDSRVKDNSSTALAITVGNQAQPIALSPFTMTTSSTTVTSLGSTYFDGTGDYLTLPHNKSLYLESGDFTIEFWYNSSIAFNTGYGPCIGFGYKNTPTGGWVIYRNTVLNTNSITIRVAGQGGAGMVDFSTTSTVEKDVWNHWAVVRSGTSLKWYKNGVLDASTTNSVNITDTDSTTLGYVGYAQQWGYAAQGYLADVRVVKGTAIYTSNFLPPQLPLTPIVNTKLLTCQYNGAGNNNGFVDQSCFNNIITRNGNVTQGTFSPYSQTGWSTYFNRSRIDSTLTGKSPGTGSFTYEFFFNVAVKDAAIANVAALFSTRGGGTGADGFDVEITTAGAVLIGTSGSTLFTSSSGLVNNGTWYHLAIVRNGSTNWTVYLNGSSIGTLSNATNFTSVNLYLGVFGGASQDWFKGYISNFRYTRDAVYTSNFTPSTVPLTAITNTEFLGFQSNAHKDNSANNFAVTPVALNGSSSIQAYSPFGSVRAVPAGYSYSLNTGNVEGCVYYPDKPALRIGTNQFTMECWVNLTQWVNGSAIIATKRAYNSTGTGSWIFYIGTNGAVSFDQLQTPATVITTAAGAVTTGSWYHIALTRDSSNVMRIYINGVNSGTTAPTSTFNFSSTEALYVGKNNDSGNYKFIGRMSNFRLVNGTALYTEPSNITIPTAALTAINNTALLTYHSNTVEDGSINNFVPVVIGPGVLTASTINPFGTITNSAVYTPSVNGGSMYFDGTDDYLTAVNSRSFDLSSGPWTIECWFYQFAGKTVQLFSVGAAAWRLDVSSTGMVSFVFNNGSSVGSTVTTAKLNSWNHVAQTFNADGTTTATKLFLNGKLEFAGQYVPSANTTSLFYVGRNPDASGAWDFNGYISDIAITKGISKYNANFVPPVTAISTTPNTAFLLTGTNGGILDAHGSNNLETVGNVQLAPETPYSGNYYSSYFDGTGDRLTFTGGTPFNFGSDDFTIEAWVNPQSFGNLGLVFFSNFVPSGVRFVLYLGSAGIGIDSGGQFTTSGTTTCSLGTWYHCAVVKSGTSIKTFVNGIQVSTATSPATYWVTANTSVTVGDYIDDYSTGYGYISNLRVVKGQALYSGAFTPSTSPLTSTSVGSTGPGAAASVTGTVSLLTCQSNKFIDNSSNNALPTVSGNPAVKSMNPFQQNTGNSLYFDGTGDYIANYTGAVNLVDDKFILQKDFTIELWAYGTVNNSVFVSLGNENSGRFTFFTNTSNQLAYDIYLVGTTTFTNKVVPLGQWNHIALVRSGSTITAYVNGTSAGTASQAAVLGNGPLSIGVNANRSANFWNGYIKDLRITKGVARYTSDFTAPSKLKAL